MLQLSAQVGSDRMERERRLKVLSKFSPERRRDRFVTSKNVNLESDWIDPDIEDITQVRNHIHMEALQWFGQWIL